jgi:uncharacterized protein (TIRG00374 family)
VGKGNLVERFRHWVIAAIAVGALLYLGGSIWAGIDKVAAVISRFEWLYLFPIIGLTLLNYGLRFVKWHYLLGRLGVQMPLGEDAWNFTAGLAMVISPGKVGELLKPYVVRARVGTPMATTIPALVTERLTDGIAMLALAGISVAAYAGDKIHYITIPAVLTIGALVVLASERLTGLCLRIGAKLPGVRAVVPKVTEMIGAMRTCVAPMALIWTVALSLVAWFAECVGYLLVFRGLGIAEATLDVSVFLYAFATIAGGAMPGGLGVADGALAAGAVTLIPGVDEPTAVAAAMIIRTFTLWIGVFIGAVALFRVAKLLGGTLDLNEEG